MHILNMMQCTNLGGMEQASLRLMQVLQKRGYSFEVVSVNALGPLAPKLAESCISAVGVPFEGRMGWRSHFRLRRVLRPIQADTVFMTGPTLSGILALGSRPRERRVLTVHFHHTGVQPRWAWRALYRLVLTRFQVVTFPSHFIRNEALEILPDLAPISHTVYNPLRDPPLPGADDRAKARRRLRLPVDRPIIGNAGWLIPRKRFDVFLQVARRVADRIPDALFVIAGDGAERGPLKKLAEELRVSDHTVWLGWQQNLDDFYQSLNVLLFNSDWDAMGLTPLEAAAFGVPVVASVLHGGLVEILGDGGAALLTAWHDIDHLAYACVQMIQDAGLAARIGLLGRDRVESRCSDQEAADGYEVLLAKTAAS